MAWVVTIDDPVGEIEAAMGDVLVRVWWAEQEQRWYVQALRGNMTTLPMQVRSGAAGDEYHLLMGGWLLMLGPVRVPRTLEDIRGYQFVWLDKDEVTSAG